MKRIMLILSTASDSPKAEDFAMDLARKECASLFVLFILDSKIPESILQKLTDIGFLGGKPSEQLTQAIMKDYRQSAYRRLQEIKEKATRFSIPCEIYLEKGEFVSESIRFIKKYSIDLCILTKKRGSLLSRIIHKSVVDDLINLRPCPIQIIED